MVVKSHNDFRIAVIQRDGVDFDQDLIRTGRGKGVGCESKVLESILVGDPLFDGGGEGHDVDADDRCMR